MREKREEKLKECQGVSQAARSDRVQAWAPGSGLFSLRSPLSLCLYPISPYELSDWHSQIPVFG